MVDSSILPHLNATANASAAVLLLSGWIAIRGGRRDLHRKLMVGAVGMSVLFLAGYLSRMVLGGHTPFAGSGAVRTLYLLILGSHSVLAAVVVPLVLRTLWLAGRGRLDSHRRLARVTLPIWVYVSVTGVVVYLMLYHLPPGS